MVTDEADLNRALIELQKTNALYRCLVEEALVGVYMVHDAAHPRFNFVNSRFAAIFGYTREELLEKPVEEVVAPGSRAMVRENIRRRLCGETQVIHYQPQGVRKDGELIELEVLGSRVLYHDEPVILGTLLDITERRRGEERVRIQQAALVELAKHPSLMSGDLRTALMEIAETSARTLNLERVGIWFYEEGRSVLRNAELYERSRGRHSRGATLRVADFPTYFAALDADRAISADEAQADPRTQELAVPYLCDLGIGSMLDAPIRLHGETVGIVCHEHVGPPRHWTPEEQSFAGSVADMAALALEATERRRAEEQLRASERMLAEAQQVAQLGSAEWDLTTNRLTGSAEFYRIFGVSPEELQPTLEAFLERVYPEDRDLVRRTFEERILQRDEAPLEFRIVRPNGGIRLIRTQGELFCDEFDRPVRMVGTVQDVTERRRAEAELEAARVALLQAEVEKKQFTREVLRATTNGKLQLVDPAEVPTVGEVREELSLADPAAYRLLRQRVQEIAEGAGMPRDHADDLVLAMGEAVTNSIKHGRQGRATVSVDAERVIVRVTDSGPGIRPDAIPATVLQPGFSTKVSLGMGYTLMLRLCDCLWLATGPEGTTVQLANWIDPKEHALDPLQTMLDRF